MTAPANNPTSAPVTVESAHPYGKCLYFTANAVARQISKLADEAIAGTGLCPSGALLLSLVVDRPGIAPSEAAEVLHLAPSSVTRFADQLERKSLVERRPSGRQVCLHPTKVGRAKLLEVQSSWEQLHQRYSEIVGAEAGERIAQELCRVAERLSAKPS